MAERWTDWRQGAGKGIAAKREISLPRDVRRAINHLRGNLHRSVPLSELTAQTGISGRTLRDHFHKFLDLSPSSYGLRLRLNAVRRELQQPSNSNSISDIALRYGFSHMSRFSHQYRRLFDEPPSATRSATAAAIPSRAEITAPASRGERPEIAIMPFLAPASLSELAELLARSLPAALADDVVVRVARPPRTSARLPDVRTRYLIHGQLIQAGDRFRAMVALTEAADGRHLWGDAWEGSTSSPFSTVDRMIAAIASTVLRNIHRSEIACARAMRPNDLEAY